MTARVIAVAGVVAALVVAVFFPPRVIAGQNGSRVGVAGYCADKKVVTSGLFDPFNPFAPAGQPDSAEAVSAARAAREVQYEACVAQGVADVPLLAVYLAGILGGSALLTWAFSPRAAGGSTA